MSDFNKHLEVVKRLNAQDSLVQLNIADYPNLKKEGREKLYKAFLDQAYPDRKKKVMTTKEMVRNIAQWKK